MKLSLTFASLFVCFLLAGFASAQETDRDRGIDLYREGKFGEAIEMLEKAVATNESDRAAWIFLGGAYVRTGEDSKAAAAFKRSSIRPNGPQPKYEKSVKITFKPRAKYTEQARRHMSSGTVRIAVEFRSDGTIGFVFPLSTSLDTDLVRQSVDAAKGTRFEPAMIDGKAVTVINFAEYGFSVR